jgi:hypothetical protein
MASSGDFSTINLIILFVRVRRRDDQGTGFLWPGERAAIWIRVRVLVMPYEMATMIPGGL